jgi:hypothetical protein
VPDLMSAPVEAGGFNLNYVGDHATPRRAEGAMHEQTIAARVQCYESRNEFCTTYRLFGLLRWPIW